MAVLDLNPEGLPESLTGFVADVSDRASVDAAVAAVGEKFGRIDIVVNNAGISAVGAVDETDDDEWLRVLNINVVGMARVSAATLPWLRRSPCAAIVNLCSVAALNGMPRRAAYGASKGAGSGAHLFDGHRSRRRGRSRQLCQPGHGCYPVRRPDGREVR